MGDAAGGPMGAEIGVFWRSIASSLDRLLDCVVGMSEADLSWRPGARGANSLAVLAVHTLGNLEENLLGTLCGREVRRDREAEFHAAAVSAAALREHWRGLRAEVETALAALDDLALDLDRTHPRRGTLTGREVLLVVARHVAEHMGQAELTRDLLRAARSG
jgi:uncharacterized damage-inducible protein DinB